MLKEDLKTPLLLIALDIIPDINFSAGALSLLLAPVLGAEITLAGEIARRTLKSDVITQAIRIPIPISDKVLPIHYVAGNTQSDCMVDYFNGEAVLHKATDRISLSFEISNSLSQISAIANIIMGLSGISIVATGQPRISFLSSSITVMNAHLAGISRSTNGDTEKEVITLNLEVAPSIIDTAVNATTAVANLAGG